MYVAVLVLLPILVAYSLSTPSSLFSDPDLWWHLANARQLITTGHMIMVEPYAFTTAAKLWVNPEWLSELPYWAAYHWLHLRGLYIATWLLVSLNLAFLFYRSRKVSGNASAAFWASVVGFMLMTLNAGPRTIVVAYLAFTAEMAILERLDRGRSRSVWLLPPLFAVWVNLHGSWLIGLALLAVFTTSKAFGVHFRSIEQEAMPRREWRQLVISTLASAAAVFLNPYGWRLAWNPFDMMFYQKLNIKVVQEWQPLNLGWVAGKFALLAILLMIGASLLKSRKFALHQLIFVVFAWYAAFAHARFTFLAAVVTTPFLATELARAYLRPESKTTIPAMNALLVAGIAVMICLRIPSEAKLQSLTTGAYPETLIAEITPGERTLNSIALGGRMDYEGKPTFIDSRMDIFEHNGIFKDYLELTNGVSTLETLDRYHIDHVLIEEKSSTAYLLEHVKGWQVSGREKTSRGVYVLVKRASAH